MKKDSSIFTLLEDLGLTKNQALIYLFVLEQGLSSVVEIARKTGISRQQIYSDAEKLISLGLFDITRKERRKFIAASPSTLAKIANERVHHAEMTRNILGQHIPFLESLLPTQHSSAKMKFFEGRKNIGIAYQRELEHAKATEVLSFAGSLDDLYRFFPKSYWHTWNTDFIKRKNTSRMLVHDSALANEAKQEDAAYHRETRTLHKFPLQVNIDIFGDTVLLVSFYDEIAVWIESSIVANSYRILFETLWTQAK